MVEIPFKHPKHWKSHEKIQLILLTHESFTIEDAKFDLKTKKSVTSFPYDMFEYLSGFVLKDGSCIGLYYTTTEDETVIRIGTTTNLLDAMNKFESWEIERYIYISIADDYNDENEMRRIKQNLKRICARNAMNGLGYKILHP